MGKKPLEIFYDVTGKLENSYITNWKQNGGKVIGYYYSGIPEELFMAAGILPFRVRATGATGTELADAYLATVNCTFVRYHLNQVLSGAYDFLDGTVCYTVCDHIRRANANWEHLIDHDRRWFYIFPVPQKQGEAQTQWYAYQLDKVRKSIEEEFDVKITDEKIWEAIQQINEIRALQRKLQGLRLKDKPLLTGADMLAAMVAGYSMPKDEYKVLLKQYISELESLEGFEAGKRLMLIGGELDNPELLRIIEGQGATIITDMMWYGNRSIMKDVPETEGDPLLALADYSLNIRPQDARTVGTNLNRYAQIHQIGQEEKIDGYIHIKVPQCDLYNFDQDDFCTYARLDTDMQVLALEVEYIPKNVGQLTTRVQAFIETL